MATIGKLNYQITADTSGFTKGMVASKTELREGKKIMEESRTPAEKYGDRMTDLNTKLAKGAITQDAYARSVKSARLEKLAGIPVIGRFASSIAGTHPALIAAGVALGTFTAGVALAKKITSELTAIIKEQLGTIDELGKTADSVGATANELVVLRKAGADFGGIEAPQMDQALRGMTKRLGEAAAGTGEAKNVIAQLGITAKDISSSASDNFKLLASRISKISNPLEQARISAKLFGDEAGVKLLNVLREGSAGIEEMKAKVRDLGNGLSAIDVARVKEANDAISDVRDVFTGLKQDIAIEAAPALTTAQWLPSTSGSRMKSCEYSPRRSATPLPICSPKARHVRPAD
jgi:hypothetical protein